MHRASRTALREAEIQQERAGYRARTEQGGTVSDLEALAAAGKRFGVICPDFPWAFETYSGKGKQRSADRRYDTWPLEPILAMAPLIRKLAADDCALLLWTVCPEQPARSTHQSLWLRIQDRWISLAQDHAQCRDHRTQRQGAALGHGLRHKSQYRASVACRPGKPLRLAADVHQVVIAPIGEHSVKPDEVYRRIERLYPGPYLELFARKQRPNWMCWGDELPPLAPDA